MVGAGLKPPRGGAATTPPGPHRGPGGFQACPYRNPVLSADADPALPPVVAEEGAHILDQRLGLLQRGEVAASGHRTPALDVVVALGARAGRADDLAREGDVRGRRLDARTARHRVAAPVQPVVVGPEGG